VPAAEWDALAGDDNPFLEHAFLSALEESESVGTDAGCVPLFVAVRAAPDGPLLGAAPLYLKTNSYGEFIFDWSWASAAHRAGLPYYPKLVAAVPFTPVTGSRLLVRPDLDVATAGQVTEALIAGMHKAAEETESSSVHVLFCSEDESRALGQHRFVPRLSMQFHWHNRPGRPFENFDDYLSTFRSRNRKQVRKERLGAAAHGLSFRTATGDELTEREWAALYGFYMANVDRHHGTAYLTPAFFEIARAKFPKRMVATLAYRGKKPVAGTVNFEKGRHLYGRYWGCVEDLPMLHFELCYYRLIERAIERQCTLFEAGAQGEHKLKRGLVPSHTYSAHWIRHPGLGSAIAAYIKSERLAVEEQMQLYAAHSPFRAPGQKDDDADHAPSIDKQSDRKE
jgi:predicted N-acyltransferase